MTEKKMASTPLLDELEDGPWPSFVKEMKKEAHRPMTRDALLQLERSYEEHLSHWKHGGLVGVMGYGGGVIGRYSDLADEFPAVAEFHTQRVNQPSGWFYTSDALRTLCDIWDRHGSGLTNMHGSTGRHRLSRIDDGGYRTPLRRAHQGRAGTSAAQAPTCAPRAVASVPARCEWACYDTLDACYNITQSFQDELHRPFFPLQVQVQVRGLPE